MPRGGPRPGFGGRQPGAGRPPNPVTDKPVHVVINPDTTRRMDAVRGDTPRSTWVNRLIEKHLDDGLRDALMEVGDE